MTAYYLMKKAIEKHKLSTNELMERINIFYANGDLTTDEFEELKAMLD